MLVINSLSITVEKKTVIHDLYLTLHPGRLYALMGPNGSGKSSFAYALMGHPRYHIIHGNILFNGSSLLSLAPHERAHLGIFVAFQNSHPLPGVTVFNFLKETYCALKNCSVDVIAFQKQVVELLTFMGLSPSFIDRQVHDGFSGGEKKRFEMVQALLYQPRVVILDELDSGLDIDALSKVAAAIERLLQHSPDSTILFITHYQRMLTLCQPDRVFVVVDGRLCDEGGADVVQQIEARGYDDYRAQSGTLSTTY